MTKNEFNEKWENYWYHYKWHTLAGIFVAICLIFTISDFATRDKIDLDLTYIGDYMDYEGLSTALATEYDDVITDFNNDGKIKVEVNAIYPTGNIAQESDLNFWQRIDIDLINGESYIYLVDEHLLESFVERGANGVIKTKDGYLPYIDISENEFFKPYLSKDKKVYLCVRKYFSQQTDEKIKTVEEASLRLIEKILEK